MNYFLILLITIKPLIAYNGIVYEDTPKGRATKARVASTIYDNTYINPGLRGGRIGKKEIGSYSVNNLEGVGFLFDAKTDTILDKVSKKIICKFKDIEDIEDIRGLTMCSPKEGGYFFTGVRHNIPNRYRHINAYFRVIDILDENPVFTLKDFRSRSKSMKFQFKAETYKGIKIFKGSYLINRDKLGYDQIRKRSKILLRKHPELTKFINDLNECFKIFKEDHPCSKRFFYDHQYYPPLVDGHFASSSGLRLTQVYLDIKKMMEKVIKNIHNHLIFDHESKIYITENPEKYRIHLTKRNGKWIIRSMDAYDRHPFNNMLEDDQPFYRWRD